MSTPRIRYVSASPLELRIRELFDSLQPGDTLTCKQVAARLGIGAESVQNRLSLLLDDGTLERRRSWDATRPYKYQLSGRAWPDETLAQIAYKALSDARYRKQVKAAVAASEALQGR